MAMLHDKGMVDNVGVSNFSGYRLGNALHVSDVPIAVNQIEFNPRFQRPDLVEYCRSEGVAVEAAAPLARTACLENDTVRELADAYDRTPAQVVLRWAVEKEIVVLPGSGSPGHVAENVDLFGWELAPEDHRRIDGLDRNDPVYDTLTRDWSRDVYVVPE
jgi:diketogulonate reductase-like aldo/keto reductase